ncbi:MAG: ubiquinone/menaquinone biosynthesis methyltransferase [Candidatus Hydrogenedentes bacterium]|nr:ubiquinone/menaquinone biosynthesis methyltransferase [Candidatus Hydrogenedentota bacterium]
MDELGYRNRRRTDAMDNMFADVAPRYELLNRVMSLGADRRWRRAAAAALPANARVVLDLCAGTGNMAEEVVRTRTGTKVVLIDICQKMYSAGTCVSNPAMIPLLADARTLPLQDETVDAAIVGFGLRNIDDIDSVLDETFRVLRPAGVFSVLDCSIPPSGVRRHACRFYLHKVIPMLAWIMAHRHRHAYRYLTASIEVYARDIDIEARMAQAGFVDIRSRPLMFGAALLTVAQKPAS